MISLILKFHGIVQYAEFLELSLIQKEIQN